MNRDVPHLLTSMGGGELNDPLPTPWLSTLTYNLVTPDILLSDIWSARP